MSGLFCARCRARPDFELRAAKGRGFTHLLRQPDRATSLHQSRAWEHAGWPGKWTGTELGKWLINRRRWEASHLPRRRRR